LSGTFWVYAVLAGIALTVFRKRTENPLFVYCVVLFAAPPFLKLIPGVGGIEHIIGLDYYRLLALVVLLPAVLWHREEAPPAQIQERPAQGARGRRKVVRASRWGMTDRFMLAFLGWLTFVRIANDSITGDIRGTFYLITDYWLPYYAASRLLTSMRQIQQVIAAFCVAALILGCLAMFERERVWLLYTPLAIPFDMPPTGTMYLVRASDTGRTLRAQVSLGQPIPLGYVLAIAIALFSGIAAHVPFLSVRAAFYGAFSAGLLASMSRGPWSGAAIGLIGMLAVGKSTSKRLLKFSLWGSAAFALFLLTPWADTVIAYLPFVGTVETGNIDYRNRLIDVSLELLGRNPLFGDFFYLTDPLMEQMRQGEGIIDVVNTYLEIALPYGCIGLALFLGVFLPVMVNLLRICRRVEDPEAVRVGRALFGAMVTVMIIIGTASSISAIDKVYFLITGLCVSYARTLETQLSVPVRQPRARRPAAAMARSMG
jgi:hypothetical protein